MWRSLGGRPAVAIATTVAGWPLTVAAYHGVSSAGSFAQHLDYFGKQFHPISLSDLLDAVRSGTSLPPKSVLLTFDDGDRSIYDTALPLLVERRLPAVVFVVPGLVGTDQPFWWDEAADLVRLGGRATHLAGGAPAAVVQELKRLTDQARLDALDQLRLTASGSARRHAQLSWEEVRELNRSGVSVANHTHRHPLLDRCSDDVLSSAILDAHVELTRQLGAAPLAFAYPNGNVDARAVPLLQEHGYEVAFVFDHRRTTTPVPDRWAISRVRVDAGASLPELRAIVHGLHPAIQRMRDRVT